MERDYPIGRAKQGLPAIIHEVERTGRATITRRGRPVAVVLSIAELERIESFRRKALEWSAATLDTRKFKFDREEANAR